MIYTQPVSEDVVNANIPPEMFENLIPLCRNRKAK